MRGGARPGAGRKAGVPNKRTSEMVERVAADGIMPLDYMLQILRDENATPDARMWAAEKAAPYLHSRLANVQVAGDGGGPLETKTKVTLTFV